MLGRCNNILEAVGRTPLVRLNHVASGSLCPVYAKVEMVNPGGSIKDRVAIAMVEEAERNGALKPGGTIIEATSGNTGVGLAMVAAVKGYRCIFIMPDKMSAEKTRLLEAYGAEVVYTPAAAPSNSPEGYSGVAARLLNEIPNSFQPDQFSNLTNPDYHYRTTGPEIWEQTEGKVTVFVGGVGTGGTLSGVGKYLKDQNSKIRVVGADPEGSVLSGGPPCAWAVEGIGEDYVPKTFNAHMVDEWVRVSDTESFHMARKMARHEGLLVGGSSGTAVAAGLRFAHRLGADDLMVVMCPDTGRNYLSKVYSDKWMIEKGFMKVESQSHTISELLKWRGPSELIAVTPDQTVESAIQMLRGNGISQLPVIEDGKVVGAIREITVARTLHEGKDTRQVRVHEMMARPLPQLDEKVDLDEVYRLLMSGNSGVVALRKSEIVAIVTRIDLVNFWDALRPTADAPASQPANA